MRFGVAFEEVLASIIAHMHHDPNLRRVPIASFKDRLSEFISAVEAGEEIVVTRHGRAVVHLTPAAEPIEERPRRVRANLEKAAALRQAIRRDGRSVSAEEWIAWSKSAMPCFRQSGGSG